MITPWKLNAEDPEYYQEIISEDGHLHIKNEKYEDSDILEIRDVDGDLVIIRFRDQKTAKKAGQILMGFKNLC